MIQHNLAAGFSEDELQAVVGLVKLKRSAVVEINHLKYKKSTFQIEVLKKVYEIINFPSADLKQNLSALLAIPQKSVKIWFQNTRQAYKLENPSSAASFLNESDLSIKQILEIIRITKATMRY